MMEKMELHAYIKIRSNT